MKNKIVNIVVTLLLAIIVVIEVFSLVRILVGKPPEEVLDEVLDDVTPTVPTTRSVIMPEVLYDGTTGDVISYNGQKFRISGTMIDQTTLSSGYIDYVNTDSEQRHLTLQLCYGVDELISALEDYFDGNYETIKTFIPTNVVDDNLTYYMQDTPDGAVAEIYNEGDGNYYLYMPLKDVYLLITAQDVVTVSRAPETVVFGDPSKDPMTEHTYSMYEVTAIENTRNELTEGEYDDSGEQLSTNVTGTADTYTSASDNETRKQMLDLGNYKWNKDGTSDETNAVIDLTSTTAKESEWVLTASSPYAFADNSLRLHTLKAVRSADNFAVNGKITNQLAAERPYVIIIKFLDSNSDLLGIRVVDKRNDPIPSSDVSDWSFVLSADGDIDISEINALQFEIY